MARAALSALVASGMRLCIAPQNIIEFWAVATRPTATNGLGLTTQQAGRSLLSFKTSFDVLPDEPWILDEWERLVAAYSVMCKPSHDARLVALMLLQNITHILTFNTKDFLRYAPECITVVDPANVTI